MADYFSQETMDFLFENRLQNSKSWFEEHRKRYDDYVVRPLKLLAENLLPELHKIDGELRASCSRVWRDARFSKDKSLFRDTMWCMFIRKKNVGMPEFFFVFSPEGVLYGTGYYSAGAESMDSMRKLILANDEGYQDALEAYKAQDIFRIEGDKYKRTRHPDVSDEMKDWLDRKTICFLRDASDFDLLYSPRLSVKVAEEFMLLAPIYRFLMKAEERK
ncbi:MAG: DUF2461 domain-containing protein [Defluviitaleaceae bacterium]|nr:DUF2461 domain-containing protein [Defluviitaleaceae bacterium]